MTDKFVYSPDEIEGLNREARDMGLEGWMDAGLVPPEEAARLCNGVGAAWMNHIKLGDSTLSRLLTNRFFCMEVPAYIHDLRYAEGGTAEDRRLADSEFYRNCLKSVAAHFSWLSHPVMRIRGIVQARALYRALRLGGALAWRYVK